MSFFVSSYLASEGEPPPAEHARPAWLKPEDALPRIAALDLVLVHTDAVAIGLTGLWCYSNGFEFGLEVVLRQPDRRGKLMNAMHQVHTLEPGEPIPPELLRVGLEFADGTKVTNMPGHGHPFGREPDRPILFGGARGGGHHTQSHHFWVWPLPPAGLLTFVCEWPYFQVGETQTTMDAELILDAAARSSPLWPSP